METVVEIKEVSGQLHRIWHTEWKAIDGVLTVYNVNNERYTVFAKGQWVYAKDVYAE